MLAPKKVKYRKWQKGRLRGLATRGASLAYGDIGLKATQHGHLSSQQIEAARIAMMRHIKRGGKVWIRIFPDRPVTAKPLETRQGSGKGALLAGALLLNPDVFCMKSRALEWIWQRKPLHEQPINCRSRRLLWSGRAFDGYIQKK